ncbi:MAG TPA: rhodanese-like domain-containing protein, partial [Stellaceae bacterium]|nr:rhodanese-like domain-containing protein [Stellaceae bacterium]
MGSEIKRIGARALKGQLHDGGEIALLDAREEGLFATRHLLMASCVPLSRLELIIDALVPRRSARTVWCDDGDGSALRAARRMAALGYADVALLDGGIAAWEAAGFRVYSGVHVPSKAFAEVVEHEAGTPYISAPELKALIDRGADIAIFDSRSYEEYHDNSIPGATSVPGAELVYRFADLAPSPDTTIIVNCGGRTRSIIGAQSLRNAGFGNRIVSLKDGTMAWHLAGFEVVSGARRRPPEVSAAGFAAASGAAARVAARCGIRRIDIATLRAWRSETDRSLYLLDVRTPEEYAAGHLAGARSTPGGQLVQETDAHIATWNARIVLVDDNGVRATMTASWLKQMGWGEVAVLVAGPGDGDWVAGPDRPAVLGLDGVAANAIEPAALRAALAAGGTEVVDLDTSRAYARGHIPGAWFAIRSRLAEALATLPVARQIVLTSPDGALARLAAADLGDAAPAAILALAGGTEA